MRRLFSELEVWLDGVERGGAENMAVDEVVLTRGLRVPLIRFYQWSDPTVTLGYFEKLADAKKMFPREELDFVRRWTGGGIVDHRGDFTYSLFVPRGNVVEQMRGNQSYLLIHEVLVESLKRMGLACRLISSDSDSASRACFENPVTYDVIDTAGNKLAGAGQKRSKYGLLHQGSVVVESLDYQNWVTVFGSLLSEKVKVLDEVELHSHEIEKAVKERYGNSYWTRKR